MLTLWMYKTLARPPPTWIIVAVILLDAIIVAHLLAHLGLFDGRIGCDDDCH
jgi:hypothetical protein